MATRYWKNGEKVVFVAAFVALVASLAFLSFRLRDGFQFLLLLPALAGVCWAVLSVTFVVIRRYFARRVRTLVVVFTSMLALSSGLTQHLYETASKARSEKRILAELSARPAPAVDYSFVVNHEVGDPVWPPGEGETTIVYFWGVWSRASLAELSCLQAIHASGRAWVVAVTALDPQDRPDLSPAGQLHEIERVARLRSLTYPIVLDTARTTHRGFHVKRIPTLVVIDNDRVRDYVSGPASCHQRVVELDPILATW